MVFGCKPVKRSAKNEIGTRAKQRKVEYTETPGGEDEIFNVDNEALSAGNAIVNSGDKVAVNHEEGTINAKEDDEEKAACAKNKVANPEDKVENPENETATEAIIASSSQTEERDQDAIHLDTLPDDVLFVLLSYLNSTDLLQVGRCNRRMYNISGDKTLWTRVNAVSDGRSPSYGCIPSYLHAGTVSIKISKNAAPDEREDEIDTCFGNDFFTKVNKLPNLKTLHIINHSLDRNIVSIGHFPASITELRLTGTKLTDAWNYLNKIEEILPNLELIDLSYCQWFDPWFLVPLAKCRKLKVLMMVGCRNMKNIIPYASIAAAYGYSQLETLDMRLTGVVDREISCFNRITTLKHIYLERPDDVDDREESITDICITSLGMRNWRSQEADDANANRVVICRIPRDGGSFSDHVLETLVVRNYPRITDITLKHAEKCLRSLKYLDVTGSSCSVDQVATFRNNRPEVCLKL